jgi:hypothetical protein
MRLGVVALSQIAVRVRTGGIEIAQHGDAQAFRPARLGENLLAGKLRALVGVDWV